jgi:hypothetical protein
VAEIKTENRMCIICTEAPAVTTEGTCAFCDEEKATPKPAFSDQVRAKAITAMTMTKTRGR